MKIIYKYPLHLMEQQILELPAYAVLLDIQKQDGQYQMWALVDTEQPTATYRVTLVGTGVPIHDGIDLRSSILQRSTQDGWAVWHWFVQLG